MGFLLHRGCTTLFPAARDGVQSVQRIAKLTSVVRQSIRDFGRNGRLVLAIDKPFTFEQAQAIGQDLGGNIVELPLQDAKSERPVLSQSPEDIHGPGSHEDTEQGFNRTGWLMREASHW